VQFDVGFPIEGCAHLLPHLAELGAVASSARGEQQSFLYRLSCGGLTTTHKDQLNADLLAFLKA